MGEETYALVNLDVKGGESGSLIALESETSFVPFDLSRVYYIYGVNSTLRRGFHAHKALKQLLVCVAGSCKVMLDDGSDKTVLRLDRPSQGLLINKPLWREMFNFSDDCVLMVLASEHYNTEDYIWDYVEFQKFVGVVSV